MILSSRCGRGRWFGARATAAALSPNESRDFRFAQLKLLRGLGDACGARRACSARELAVRIAPGRRVAVGFDAIAEIEERRGVRAERLRRFPPSSRRKTRLRLSRLAFSRQTVGVLGGVEAAFRRGHVAQHVVEDVARDGLIARRRA